jgi:hypothetical protein
MVGYYLPKFDGQNLSVWMHKIHQFSNYYDTPDYHRYMVASYHMEGGSDLVGRKGNKGSLYKSYELE